MHSSNGRAVFASILLCFLTLESGPSRRILAASDPDRPNTRPRTAATIQLVPNLGHSASVNSVAFSPNGRLVLTGSSDGSAKLWDSISGAELRSFLDDPEEDVSATFSPDGRYVLTWSVHDDAIATAAKLWEASSGAKLRSFSGHTKGIISAAFSPDGGLVLTGGQDETAKLWDTKSGAQLRSFSLNSPVAPVAFSPDGNSLLTGLFNGTAKLWDKQSGKQLPWLRGRGPRARSLPLHGGESISSVAFSPDGRFVLTGSSDQTAKLWDANSGALLRSFTDNSAIESVAFSPDGRTVLTGSWNSKAKLWDASSGEPLRSFSGHKGAIMSAVFSPDGRLVLTGSRDHTAKVWDAGSGDELRSFSSRTNEVNSVAFSPDGQSILTGTGGGAATLWGAASGAQLRSFIGHTGSILSAGFSWDGRFVLTGSSDDTAKLWDARSGVKLRSFGNNSSVTSVAFSPDGRFALTGTNGGAAKLWDAGSGAELRSFFKKTHLAPVESVAFSANGRFILTGKSDPGEHCACDAPKVHPYAELWDAESGARLRSFPHASSVRSVAFSPDGRSILTGSEDKTAKLWDALSGTQLRSFVGNSSSVVSAVFSPDGRFALTGSEDGTARLWDVGSGAELRSFSGHTSYVNSVAFSPDARWVLTGSSDGTAKLWDTDSGGQLCSLILFRDGTWAVVDPSGRFDTNNLDGSALNWVADDDPMTALPLEVFMRDYYEPRLLARILAGETLPPIRSIANLDRAQPEVDILGIERPGSSDLLMVTVEVASTSRILQRDEERVDPRTGVFDLQVFANGQLVGAWPKDGGEIKVDPQTKRARVTFPNIRIRRQEGSDSMTLSAYAFNVDRVKSSTARKDWLLPKDFAPEKRRAYIVAVGVNACENPEWNLRYSVPDARTFLRETSASLGATGDFKDIVTVPLLSSYDATGRVTERGATKANIRAVFEVLSGRNVDPAMLHAIPNVGKLRAALPEDMVLIAFSAHGYKADGGDFYLVPYDVGANAGVVNGKVPESVLSRFISAAELSLWLRDVDAGSMAMVIDACHSGAFAGEAFKPGPMGARGLGQLAYDKGMRILAASQSDQFARGSGLLQSGLLTYALTVDGLVRGRADLEPADRKISLAEWLEYGLKRVPELHASVIEANKTGQLPEELRPLVTTTSAKPVGANADAEEKMQTPALFDFVKQGRRNPVIGTARQSSN